MAYVINAGRTSRPCLLASAMAHPVPTRPTLAWESRSSPVLRRGTQKSRQMSQPSGGRRRDQAAAGASWEQRSIHHRQVLMGGAGSDPGLSLLSPRLFLRYKQPLPAYAGCTMGRWGGHRDIRAPACCWHSQASGTSSRGAGSVMAYRAALPGPGPALGSTGEKAAGAEPATYPGPGRPWSHQSQAWALHALLGESFSHSPRKLGCLNANPTSEPRCPLPPTHWPEPPSLPAPVPVTRAPQNPDIGQGACGTVRGPKATCCQIQLRAQATGNLEGGTPSSLHPLGTLRCHNPALLAKAACPHPDVAKHSPSVQALEVCHPQQPPCPTPGKFSRNSPTHNF